MPVDAHDPESLYRYYFVEKFVVFKNAALDNYLVCRCDANSISFPTFHSHKLRMNMRSLDRQNARTRHDA